MGLGQGLAGNGGLSSSVVTASSAPLPDSYVHSFSAALGPVMSPQPVTVDSGTFTPKSATVDVSAILSGGYMGRLVAGAQQAIATPPSGYVPGAGGVAFLYVGPVAQSPLVRQTQGGALKAGVQEIAIGGGAQIGWYGRVSGLTPGTTYAWELAIGIVGAYYGLNLPESPTTGFSVSSGTQLVTQLGWPSFGAVMFALSSTTKLHVGRLSHVDQIQAGLLTGAGFALPGGRATGSCAISPNGLRVASANYSLNNVTIYDISTQALAAAPSLAATVTTVNTPYQVVWSPDSTTLYVIQYASAGTGQWQKITAANTGAPVAQAAVNLDTNALTITGPPVVTPDNSKLLAVAGGAGWVYIANTATGAFTATAPPAGLFTTPPVVVSNALGYILSITGGVCHLCSIALGTGVVTDRGALGAVNGAPALLAPHPDGQSLMMMTNAATAPNIYQLDLRSGQTPGNFYTSWVALNQAGAAAAPVQAAVTTNLGDILVATANNLNVWPGGQWYYRGDNPSYMGHAGQLRISPAS